VTIDWTADSIIRLVLALGVAIALVLLALRSTRE
jgi:hypothetical protein